MFHGGEYGQHAGRGRDESLGHAVVVGGDTAVASRSRGGSHVRGFLCAIALSASLSSPYNALRT